MPDQRTTRIAKLKAHRLAAGDLIKVGGRWYSVEDNHIGYASADKRHLRLTPEGNDSGFENLSIFVNALTKFKVRTPK